jgi:hypothetical protein
MDQNRYVILLKSCFYEVALGRAAGGKARTYRVHILNEAFKHKISGTQYKKENAVEYKPSR